MKGDSLIKTTVPKWRLELINNAESFDLCRTDSGSWTLYERKYENTTVVASVENRIIGRVQGQLEDDVYSNRFTLVSKRWQRKGVGTSMWVKLLEEVRPQKVSVSVASDKGLTLIKSVEIRFPDISFQIYEDGQRKLRNLTKRKSKKKRTK